MAGTLDPFKRGDTIGLGGTVLLPAGAWSASSWLARAADGFKVAAFAVTLEPLAVATAAATHAIALEISAAVSATLPAGAYVADVRFTEAGGQVKHSPSFALELQAGQTGAPA